MAYYFSMGTKFLPHLHYLCFHFTILANLVCFSRAQADNYIIHMDLEAMPKAFSDHHSWYTSTVESISDSSRAATPVSTVTSTTPALSSSSKLLYTYTHAINGFSARLTPTELKALKSLPGYIHSTRDIPVTKDTTYSPKFLGLTQASGAWPTSDYGKDVIIGLVDTGIWPESKSFIDRGMTSVPSKWKGTCERGTQFRPSMCNKKLIGARYFNRALVSKDPNITISMNSARDTDGHGTHTSSTAAGARVEGASYFGYGTGTASGMAPSGRVAMYKALWEEGSSTADVIAAVDAAIEDGVDVLSMSLGFDVAHLTHDPVAIATFAATEKGIFVALSAGNRGPSRGSLHNGTPWATTVAAGTTDRQFGGTITLGNGMSLVGSTLYPLKSTITDAQLVYMDGCDDSKELKKKLKNYTVAVCLDVNGTAIYQQIHNMDYVEVAGAIFITNATDLSLFLSDIQYPAILLDPKAGKSLTDYIKSSVTGKPLASLDFQKTYLGASQAPKAVFYTSRGPSPTCPGVLKPDLMAPGDMILASWTLIAPIATFESTGALYNNFNIISGTSMACPHVAGVAALLKGVHRDWSPAAIRSALITTADPLDNTGQPIKDYDNRPASVLAMGAGQINPNKALDPGLVYDVEVQDYVNLLCGLNYSDTQIRIVTRSLTRANCSSLGPPGDFNYPSFTVLIHGKHGSEKEEEVMVEEEFSRVVTNVGEGSAIYEAKVEGLKGGDVEVMIEPEKLEFKEKNEKLGFKVRVKAKGVGEGSISWVESQGKYVVRSPILVTRPIGRDK